MSWATRITFAMAVLLATQSAAAQGLAFEWPDSGRVELEIQRISVQRRVAVQWQLHWERTERGYRFELVDPRLRGLHAAGRELPLDDEFARSVAAIEAVIPSWQVDEQGRFLQTTDAALDGAVARAESLLGGEGPDADYGRMGREALQSSGLRLEAVRRARDLWLSWVEEWVGLRPEPGSVDTDSLRVAYLDESMRGERIRQVVALPRIRRARLADLRSSFEVALASGLRRQVLREARVDERTLRPLRATQRISLGDAYEETLVTFHWPDLPAH